MYYVIQRHHNNYQKRYLAYAITKYISAKNTQNIIIEMNHDGVIKRKWAPKEDIILLTADKELFRATMEQLEAIKEHHLEKINAAQEKLNLNIAQFNEALQKEFEIIQSSYSANLSC